MNSDGQSSLVTGVSPRVLQLSPQDVMQGPIDHQHHHQQQQLCPPVGMSVDDFRSLAQLTNSLSANSQQQQQMVHQHNNVSETTITSTQISVNQQQLQQSNVSGVIVQGCLPQSLINLQQTSSEKSELHLSFFSFVHFVHCKRWR